VIAWLFVMILGGAASGAAGSGFSTKFSPPDVESARGIEILTKHFGGVGSGFGGTIVFKADQGVEDPAVKAAMTEFLDQVDAIDRIAVVSPYSPQGQVQIARQGPLAGKLAFAQVEVQGDVSIEDAAAVTKEVKALAPQLPGLEIEYGGQLFAVFAAPKSEVLGLGFAIVVLILAFGSVLAMGLPVGTALGGIGVGVTIVTLLSNVLTMPDFTTVLAVMIGLGVGIDYALFIVTRYREGLHAGLDSEHAAAVALNTAGRAVIFAGTTVVISLLGMLLMGLAFVRGLAIGAATVVLVTMIASLTLLPALLGFVRGRVEVTRWRGIISAGLVALALIAVGIKLPPVLGQAMFLVAVAVLLAGFFLPVLKREVPRPAPRPVTATIAYRWSRFVQRHPWASVIAGLVVLLILAVPLLSIRLGFSDEGNAPSDTSTRKAYDLLAAGFGPGFNGPLILAAELPAGANLAELPKVTEALSRTPGVAFATPALPDNPNQPTAVLWRVIPTTAPQDRATESLLHRLRTDVLPAAAPDIPVAITGQVAISADFSKYLGDRMPLFIGVVLSLSFLLLMAVFRSLLVPLKAVVMNLISIGAAYGLVVAVFQWGWAKDLIGIGKGGPIEPFIPMMMFAIVFGLSMDYEVFRLSRVKEEYDRGKPNELAVADGLAATARVITAAAAIMVVVFGSFLLEADRIIKVFGVGLASAVFLDATIVRMLLVPATMELLGDRNWWLPPWLGRLLPNIDVEGLGDESLADLHADQREELPVNA
jgi:RND superfamily putative drug exporter